MLSNVGLNQRFWAEAISTTCFLINHAPHSGIQLKTPYEMWFGKPADYSNLSAFGCTVYYHVSEGKLKPRAKSDVFMGYGEGVKGYRIWSPSENRVILSRNVVFDENSLFNPTVKSTIVSKIVLLRNRWSSKSLMMRVMNCHMMKILNTHFQKPFSRNLRHHHHFSRAWLVIGLKGQILGSLQRGMGMKT